VSKLHTTMEPGHDELVLRLAGPLDLAEAEFLRELLDALAQATDRPVVLDLAHVETIDSIGIGVLLGAERRFRERGNELRLRRAMPPIMRRLAIAGVTRRVAVDG
jgi:anti-sigma B factor antagonist